MTAQPLMTGFALPGFRASPSSKPSPKQRPKNSGSVNKAGPAVVTGHVDSTAGPAVFFRLRQAAIGDLVTVTRADGSTVRFTVTRVERYPKTAFPSAEVYAPTPGPELRLITCGGAFDRTARSYLDDVVVYAALG